MGPCITPGTQPSKAGKNSGETVSIEVPPGSCPYCGVVNRESEAIHGLTAPPEEGTIMICESCANFSIYIGHGATRKPDDYERATLLEDHDLVKAVLQAQLDLM